MPETSFITLSSDSSSLVIDCQGHAPAILYWGPKLGKHTSPEMIKTLSTRHEALASPQKDVAQTMLPTDGEGFTGYTALKIHSGHRNWSASTNVSDVTLHSEHHAAITSNDDVSGIRITHTIRIHPSSNVVSIQASITNTGQDVLDLDWLAAASVPIAPNYTDILSYEGRWAKEFQLKRITRFCGNYLRENRKGRTSHDNFPAVLLAEKHCNDHQGQVYGFHLGWSGNHRTCVEDLYDGRAQVQMGELLFPGEMSLATNEEYTTPIMYGLHSSTGLNGISKGFQHFVRETLLTDLVKNKPRPIHFNTWEALYFDHDPATLMSMVDDAADIGAERFVLDDGWFNHRRHDRAGLGDWYVDKSIYPDGLKPLVDYVLSKDMEFGLWFEPEMVNADSDLYRAHPDWAMQLPHVDTVPFRNQLVLDLTRKEVSDYLFERIDALLSEYAISYIKWDMNRDIHQPGGANGEALVHKQTLALYALIQRLKAKHPNVEIESCSSGGARVDYGILRYTDRVWTSDSNDALDRLSIQRGLSLFLPPEVMGSHVGPKHCHITGRELDIRTRTSTAIFGHMGMEVDLKEFNTEDKQVLKDALVFHKKFRPLIHGGNLVRTQINEHSHCFGVVSHNQDEALYSYTELGGYPRHLPDLFMFHGLDPEKTYSLNIAWPVEPRTTTSTDTANEVTGDTFSHMRNTPYSGEALIQYGLQLPILLPESTVIFHLKAI